MQQHEFRTKAMPVAVTAISKRVVMAVSLEGSFPLAIKKKAKTGGKFPHRKTGGHAMDKAHPAHSPSSFAPSLTCARPSSPLSHPFWAIPFGNQYNVSGHRKAMIQSFADHDTEDLFLRENNRRHAAIARVALRKLIQMNRARLLTDLAVLPGNRLEALKSDLAGSYSIRVNDQWRIVFVWTVSGPAHVT